MQHPRIHLHDLLRCAERAHDNLSRENPTINPKEARQFQRWRSKHSRLLLKLAEHLAQSVFDQELPPQLDEGSNKTADRPGGIRRPHAPKQPVKVRPPRPASLYDPLEPKRDEEQRWTDAGAPNAHKTSPSTSTPKLPRVSSEAASRAGSWLESVRPDPNELAGPDPLAGPDSGSDPVGKLLQKSQSQPSSISPHSSPVDHISKLQVPPPDFVGKLLERSLSQRHRSSPHSKSGDFTKDPIQPFASTQDSDDGEDDA